MNKLRRNSDRAKYCTYFFALILVISEIWLNFFPCQQGIVCGTMTGLCIIGFYGGFFSLLVYADRRSYADDIIKTS